MKVIKNLTSILVPVVIVGVGIIYHLSMQTRVQKETIPTNASISVKPPDAEDETIPIDDTISVNPLDAKDEPIPQIDKEMLTNMLLNAGYPKKDAHTLVNSISTQQRFVKPYGNILYLNSAGKIRVFNHPVKFIKSLSDIEIKPLTLPGKKPYSGIFVKCEIEGYDAQEWVFFASNKDGKFIKQFDAIESKSLFIERLGKSLDPYKTYYSKVEGFNYYGFNKDRMLDYRGEDNFYHYKGVGNNGRFLPYGKQSYSKSISDVEKFTIRTTNQDIDPQEVPSKIYSYYLFVLCKIPDVDKKVWVQFAIETLNGTVIPNFSDTPNGGARTTKRRRSHGRV